MNDMIWHTLDFNWLAQHHVHNSWSSNHPESTVNKFWCDMVLFVHCWYILILLDTDNISHLLAWYYQFHLACILSLFHLFLSLIFSFVFSFSIFLWVSNRPLRCVKRFSGTQKCPSVFQRPRAFRFDIPLYSVAYLRWLRYLFYYPFFSWHPNLASSCFSTLQRLQPGYTAPLAHQKRKSL